MKTLNLFALALAFTMGSFYFPSLAEAGPRLKRMKQKQHRQMHRIRSGAQSGELNRNETRRLVREQKRIRRHRKQAFADDGQIDNQEARQLRRQQKRASRHIYKEKHD